MTEARRPSAGGQTGTGTNRLAAMAVTYFLGVFNDNFFKQAALLLAVAGGLSHLQGQATELFSLPFILFSAWGGWLADRFVKRQVLILAKFLELVAMAIGSWAMVTLNWFWILAMIFVMGLQSTLFGPALNGTIPELHPADRVPWVNSILKLVTTVAILLGMALAGFALDQQWLSTPLPFGRLLVAATVLICALTGLFASFRIPVHPAAGCRAKFPWSGPLVSLRDAMELRRDPLLLLAVGCDVFFYFISLLAVLVINILGLVELGLGKSATSLLAVSLMIGVCGGALVAGRWTTSWRWTHILTPGALGMGMCMIGAGLLVRWGDAEVYPVLLAILACTGWFGGLFLIPVSAAIQIRPDASRRGRVIAAANFLSFAGMWCSGRIYSLLERLLVPSSAMILLGIGTVAAAGLVAVAVRRTGGLKQQER
ncbi:MFS transporter [Desulfolithobacter sp.]